MIVERIHFGVGTMREVAMQDAVSTAQTGNIPEALSPQLSLFAWRERDDAEKPAARPFDVPPPRKPEDIAAMTTQTLLEAFEAELDEAATGPDVAAFIAEVRRRREAAAASLLLRLCRRHAGFDVSRTVPEVAGALRALAAIGAVDAAPAILRLVERDAFGPASVAAALRYFSSLRYRPAGRVLTRSRVEELLGMPA